MKRKIPLVVLGVLIMLSVFSCTRFSIPLIWSPNPFKDVRICIDPGHGGEATEESPTGGTKGPLGLREPDANLAIGLMLRDMLQQEGARVFMTRQVDRRLTPIGATYSQELNARPSYASFKDADIFISLHHNAPGAGTDPETVNYTSTYVYTEPTPFELALAQSVQHSVAALINKADRGVMKGNFHVLRENPITSILIEFSFLTHPEEAIRVHDSHYNYLEAKGVYDGLYSFLKTTNIKKIPPKRLAVEQDKSKAGVFIKYYVPRLYNPVKGDIDQRYLYGATDPYGNPKTFISFSVPEDTPVYACWEGEVVYVHTISETDPRYPYKNCVVIRHDHILEEIPIYTVYGNLKTVQAWTYQNVVPETVIGTTGSPNSEETNLKFEVRVGGNGQDNIENPELWILSHRNREAGYVVGRVVDRKNRTMRDMKIEGLVKIFGYDRTPELYTYPENVRCSTFWEEDFAISDVMPNPEGSPYNMIIGTKKIEIDVRAGMVTYVNLK